MDMKERLIIALDYNNIEDMKNLVEKLGDEVLVYKVGLEGFLNTKGEIIDYLISKNKKIFLDLKFHDIENTVVNAAKFALTQNAFIYNIHASNGFKTMQTVAEETKKSGKDTKAIAVTILTNLADDDLNIMYPEKGVKADAQVEQFATLAFKAGMDGVVCSPLEAKNIKDKCGKDFLTICPGVRPAFASIGDQKRVMTPKEALENGADYLVVGRPITAAEIPADAAKLVIEEMQSANI